MFDNDFKIRVIIYTFNKAFKVFNMSNIFDKIFISELSMHDFTTDDTKSDENNYEYKHKNYNKNYNDTNINVNIKNKNTKTKNFKSNSQKRQING